MAGKPLQDGDDLTAARVKPIVDLLFNQVFTGSMSPF
jgi:hypothetical protein